MPEFTRITVTERPYLYQERSCSMDPSDISAAMGDCFGAVFAFMQSKSIKPADAGLSVYYTHDPDRISFRSGFFVSAEDAAKAEGDTKSDVTPAGKVLHFTHKGSYATLRDDYGLMMEHLQATGLTMKPPTWEIYVNDPGQVPEDELLTEVYVSLA